MSCLTVPLGTSLPQTVSMGSNQGSSTWETADELGSGDRGHDKTSVMMDDPIRPGDRSRVLPSSHQETVFTDASLESWCIVCHGQSWSGRWQR